MASNDPGHPEPAGEDHAGAIRDSRGPAPGVDLHPAPHLVASVGIHAGADWDTRSVTMMQPPEAERRAREFAGRGLPMLIGGSATSPVTGNTYPVAEPAGNTVVGHAPDAGADDVEAAISAAQEARGSWSGRGGQERAKVVREMADVAEANLDDIAALDSLDTGVPFWMMRRDVSTGIQRMRMFADWALRLTGETVPAAPTHLTYTERIPFGVVARIVAYNHPAMFGISKIAAPLVAGNTVILKPSEQTPLSMLRLGELWAATVPPGVLAVITGSTGETGERLVRDERIRRIAFTGSPETGRAIQRAAAESAVKQVSLELGGKNALLVLPDADLDDVAYGAVKGMNFAFAGQSCGSTSRILVPRQLASPLIERLESRFTALHLGAPFDAAVQVSPLISGTHLARVRDRVTQALAATGQLVTGGSTPENLGRGNFYSPTLILDTDANSSLIKNEVFGPVLTVLATDSVEESIAAANSVRYGLTASVYGSDIAQALGVARRMEAGYVWVNDTSTHFAGFPFGGVKESGVGREESFEELLDYTALRATSVRLG